MLLPMRVLIPAFLSFFCLTASAQEIRFDTLSSRPVGPGVVHTYIEAPALPWTINVLEVDLTDPFLEMETANANDLLVGGGERTSSMAERLDSSGHRVVAGVNGDFYSGGARPISIQIADGEILQAAAADRPALGFDERDRPMMEFVELSSILSEDATELPIDGINAERGTDQLILYNKYFGPSTDTNEFGSEASVRPVGRWLANDTLRLVVEETASGSGGMSISDGMAVLSGHGAASAFLDTYVGVGDTLEAFLGVQPGLSDLKEMIGGGPYLVEDGESSVGPRGDASDRHPRTAAGFSADSTRLFLITVDGRQSTSLGMTLPELAYFMTRIDVHTGMNLDGGGSTTMVVRDLIANDPSGGFERSIANALFVVSSAPEGALEHVLLTPSQPKLFTGQSTAFSVLGTDAHFNPVDLDEMELEFSADPEIGVIDDTGVFTAGASQDTGYVYVQYNDLADSARVIVKTVAHFDLSPTEVLADTSREVPFSVRSFDQDSLEQQVSPAFYSWSTSNPDVGVVDSLGRFRGLSPGVTEVAAEYQDLRQTAEVTVEVHSGTALLSGFEDIDSWTLVGSNVDSADTELSLAADVNSQGEAALRLDYEFTFDSSVLHEVFLETDLPIAGVPDSLFLDVLSDGRDHRVFYEVEDRFGTTFDLYAASYANSADSFATQPGAFVRPNSPTMFFPIRMKRIILRLASDQEIGETYSGTLYLDNLRITYPAKATSRDDGAVLPVRAALHTNYPNPFSDGTTITFELPATDHIRLSVFDLLGREILMLEDGLRQAGRHTSELDGANLPSGVYFYRLKTSRGVLTGKMLRLR